MSMEESIFTKIINGDIPCNKIYEDDMVIAFLTIEPYTEGHTLVVPKKQVDKFYDLSDKEYAALFSCVKKIAKHLETVGCATRIVEMIYGFDVPHTHIHLIPVVDHAVYLESFRRRLAHETPYPYEPSNHEL